MEERGRTRKAADLRGPDCFCPRAKTDEELRMPLKGGSACAVVLCAGTEASAKENDIQNSAAIAFASVPAQRTSIRSSSSVFARVRRRPSALKLKSGFPLRRNFGIRVKLG